MTPSPPLDRFEARLLQELKDVVAARPAPAIPAAAPHPGGRRRRVVLSGAGVAAAVSAAVIVATSGDRTPSAYAVQSRPDGTVRVTIHDLRDAAGLQRKLRAAGVPASVTYVAKPTKCSGTEPTPPPGRSSDAPGEGIGLEAGTVVRQRKPGDPEGPAGPTRILREGPTLVTRGTPPPATAAGPTKIVGSAGSDGPSVSGGPATTRNRAGIRVAPDGTATFTLDPTDIPRDRTVVISASVGEATSISMAILKDPAQAPPPPCVPAER